MNRRLTLSVAMPNHNHGRYLPRAIEGILRQSRPPDEFLILDDASTDNSVEVIESYAREHPLIRFIRSDVNLGVIAAHERLYRLATGDYLYSAAADDDRFPTFFEQAMEMAARYPAAGLIFGQMVVVDEDGRETGVTEATRWRRPLFATPDRFLREFLEVEPPMQAMTGATIFRRDAFEEVGWCRPELGSFADTLAVRAIGMKHGVCYVPAPFYVWHRLEGSFSGRTNRNALAALDTIARAAALMRGEFRDRFPQAYVSRWAKAQRRQVLWNYFLGEDATPRRSFWLRNLRRLPRIGSLARLSTYRGRVNDG